MKKYFISLFILTSLASQAQTPTVQYGPKIGANLAYVDLIENPLAVRSTMKLNSNGGLFLRINAKKFSIQPEAYFSGNSFRVKSDLAIFSDATTKDTRFAYQYISAPLILGYEVVKGVHLQAGPQYSWALNSGKSYGPNKNNDLGIVLGARIDMLDAMSLFSLNFRYIYGLTDQTDRTYSFEGKTLPYDFRNRTVQVSISYNVSDYYRWWKKYGVKKKK